MALDRRRSAAGRVVQAAQASLAALAAGRALPDPDHLPAGAISRSGRSQEDALVERGLSQPAE